MKLGEYDRDLLNRVVDNLNIISAVANAAPIGNQYAHDNRVLEATYLELGRVLHDMARELGCRALELALESHLDATIDEILGAADPDGKPGT